MWRRGQKYTVRWCKNYSPTVFVKVDRMTVRIVETISRGNGGSGSEVGVTPHEPLPPPPTPKFYMAPCHRPYLKWKGFHWLSKISKIRKICGFAFEILNAKNYKNCHSSSVPRNSWHQEMISSFICFTQLSSLWYVAGLVEFLVIQCKLLKFAVECHFRSLL